MEGKSISDVLEMTIDDAVIYFSQDETDSPDSYRGCKRIIERLKPLQEVGLGYVQLGQSSSTLSGGEAQRIKLATFLIGGSSTTQTLFIFDEPTTGLHFHDVAKLLKSFNALIDRGHSIVVIEHNLDVIKCADWVIDIGPEGGEEGGSVVAQGTPEDVAKSKISYTAKYLKEKL